ncbi:transporter substrate-binding domain-containing protein [Pandoraea commovens]|uniref:Cysteine ABC transporter substrate-binding protein n=1 Tax=Pandoraea commovens TaxID=2508289 RepID=A0A5E4W593_9BURK|nr:transporter substrate-binding domain-containing protein [Pandoraea commovens]UVA81517.1 transporter substrate-binding domain-containing protein [Pandoraea commovens]VVE19039.1 cysteine ABC transporter substrate-binding protein [Pandoraea commovens]
MKSWLKTLCLVPLAAAALIGTSPARAADLLDTVKSAGVLKIGIEGTYPPFNYRDKSGQLDGFDVDVAKAVAQRLGVKPQFVTTEWSGIIGGLQAGKFDVIVNQVAITDERKKSLDFSEPYTYSAAQLIRRKDDKREFKTLEDLKGHKLGVSLGSNYDKMAKAVAGIDVRTYPGAPEYLADLAAGRVDAALNDQLMMAYLLQNAKLPLQAGAVLPGTNQAVGIPFRKGNPAFAKAIDDALTGMKQDGSLAKIAQKWFGKDTSKPAQ